MPGPKKLISNKSGDENGIYSFYTAAGYFQCGYRGAKIALLNEKIDSLQRDLEYMLTHLDDDNFSS